MNRWWATRKAIRSQELGQSGEAGVFLISSYSRIEFVASSKSTSSSAFKLLFPLANSLVNLQILKYNRQSLRISFPFMLQHVLQLAKTALNLHAADYTPPPRDWAFPISTNPSQIYALHGSQASLWTNHLSKISSPVLDMAKCASYRTILDFDKTRDSSPHDLLTERSFLSCFFLHITTYLKARNSPRILD